MLNALLGRKVGMTQVFGPDGSVIPVTIIEAGPCTVTQIKTAARDGYEAVQLGFEQATTKHVTRPELGHLGHSLPLLKGQRRRLQTHQQEQRATSQATEEGSSEETPTENSASPDKQIRKLLKVQTNRQRRPGPEVGPFKILREVGLQNGASGIELGAQFTASLFVSGETVDIVGTSKGKGFQGGVKRHGFSGGPKTHGQSDRHRAPGSIGSGTTPGRVLKGTRMAGRMGNERVTAMKLQVVQSDAERNLIVVKGSVPGANGSLLVIKKHVMR
jgi:large subunit ribosomal protein L3